MPLVTITCNPVYFPPDSELDLALLDEEERVVVELAQALPGLIANNAGVLGLNPEATLAEGVQVDIQKFHAWAQNAVDVWIKIEFAEVPNELAFPGEEDISNEQKPLKLRDELLHLLDLWFGDVDHYPESWAADCFFGPDHGAIMKFDSRDLSW